MLTEKQERIAQEALNNATMNQSLLNYGTIFEGFMEKGIPEADIKPRENVLTYHAWRALGRQVKKGEHGVRVVTMIVVPDREQDDGTIVRGGRRWHSTTVFHVSQTKEIEL